MTKKLLDKDRKLPDKEEAALDPEELPDPGSPEAVKLGCLCPVYDNHHGQGVGDDGNGNTLFWYSSACMLHCPDSAAEHNESH